MSSPSLPLSLARSPSRSRNEISRCTRDSFSKIDRQPYSPLESPEIHRRASITRETSHHPCDRLSSRRSRPRRTVVYEIVSRGFSLFVLAPSVARKSRRSLSIFTTIIYHRRANDRSFPPGQFRITRKNTRRTRRRRRRELDSEPVPSLASMQRHDAFLSAAIGLLSFSRHP